MNTDGCRRKWNRIFKSSPKYVPSTIEEYKAALWLDFIYSTIPSFFIIFSLIVTAPYLFLMLIYFVIICYMVERFFHWNCGEGDCR